MANVKCLVAEVDGVESEYPTERLLSASDTYFNNAGTPLLSSNTQDVILEILGMANRKTFTVCIPGVVVGLNKSMASIVNGAGSGVKIKIRDIRIFNTQTTAVTGAICTFESRRISGHSAGNDFTTGILSHDTTDVLNANVTVRSASTVSGESATLFRRWLYSSDEFGSGTADAETFEHSIAQTDGDKALNDAKPITLNAGEGLHIKQSANVSAGQFDIIFSFTEELT